MWEKVKTYLKVVFFQGWFWAEKAEQKKAGLTLIIVMIVLIIIIVGLAKVGFFKRGK